MSRAGAPVSESVLEVRGVDVRLSGHKILDQVSFEIAPGEFTGLIGSNGAGKTTLFRVILGLQSASAGEVRLGGPADPGSRARRGQLVGFVPQKFMLDPDLPLRARDLVALGLDAHRLGVPRPSRARRALVDEMLAAVDAGQFAEMRVGRLSGGEQQRILIAHALIARPRLLLLDEPLANLDLRSAHDVVALLARISREQGIAVLISAHEINPLLGVMERIVYLAAGRAASGTTDEVIRADVLSKLYGHHVDVLNVHGRVLIVAGAGEATDLAGHEVAFPRTEVVS
ncbi:MAG: transporter ATP-binding protein [Solirubrobacterales bacterium]|nr:transporter ATP-binding protein [Solirubrobacterales bacterium]